ncbi:hypothetical protein [Pseudomonas matsuisoli]|nr:hypothetical protein [Pseudomonas matsuisoli]
MPFDRIAQLIANPPNPVGGGRAAFRFSREGGKRRPLEWSFAEHFHL